MIGQRVYPPIFCPVGVSMPQVETPNSRETLSRGILPPPTAALVSWAMYLCALAHAQARASAQGLATCYLAPSGILELSRRVYVRYSVGLLLRVERTPTNLMLYCYDIPGCPIFSQLDGF